MIGSSLFRTMQHRTLPAKALHPQPLIESSYWAMHTMYKLIGYTLISGICLKLIYIYYVFAQSQILSLLLCVVVVVVAVFGIGCCCCCCCCCLAKTKRNPANEFLNVERGSNVSGPGYSVRFRLYAHIRHVS
jgi:hypothetical protein